MDFASISRFLIRAEIEKQLILKETETVGIFQLLFSFLQRNGEGCYGEETAGAGYKAMGLNGELVLHEVIRGVAQLMKSLGRTYLCDVFISLFSNASTSVRTY